MTERDLQLLALLDREDRVKLEDLIDEIVQDSLPSAEPIYLEAAAMSFDSRAESLPDATKIVALQIAAALRVRAAPRGPIH